MIILDGKISITCAILLAALALTQSAYGGAECASLGGGCDDGGEWNPMAKLDEIGAGIYDQAQANANWPAESRKQRWNMSAGIESSQEEDGATATDENVLLDVSESAKEHISGSLAIPYREFLQGDWLKPVPELAEILGNEGIS